MKEVRGVIILILILFTSTSNYICANPLFCFCSVMTVVFSVSPADRVANLYRLFEFVYYT